MALYLNGKFLDVTIFPDKTSQVWKIEDFPKEKVTIIWKYEYEQEFIHLAQLKDLLDYHCIEAELDMPYLPYARQDKPISNQNTFALHTFAKLLNSLNFKSIIVFDCHSDVSLFLIKNIKNIVNKNRYMEILNILNYNSFCFPDENAKNKYSNLFTQSCYAIKQRDLITGKIVNHELIGSPNEFWRILIVDDICDGGATFVSIAKLLKEKEVKKISLFTTHGIYSKGLNVLHEAGIERIFNFKGEAFENRETKQIYYKDIIND